VRAKVSEAGCLGVAILAGVGASIFRSVEDGVKSMVTLGERFEPEPGKQHVYEQKFEKYRTLWPLMRDFLRGT
jgi:sugar (pentulose or hexulose) kinase